MSKGGIPLAMTTGIFWISNFPPLGHGQFDCQGAEELAVKGRDEGDPLSVRN